MKNKKVNLCKCSLFTWTGNDGFITSHHPNCEHYDFNQDVKDIINRLINAIELWGSVEDGIPDFVYDDYMTAKIFICRDLIPEKEYKISLANQE